uniref:Fe2OG dioxygenase domain-containing protein n=1 Tax=Aureoumbra lagunensis TaxID=44058 RepID=A0A6S8CBM1_9STRA|mmetsp:Transcript_6855/g.9592  ORF Transcript_6855/g.9592 Transcript_6855/m.9592 type:complete len:243 (+) Transcript_6855:21-749(+)
MGAHFFFDIKDQIEEDDEKRLERLLRINEIKCENVLQSLGIISFKIDVDGIDFRLLASEFSQPSPQSIFMEDSEYANYRNVMDDPNFPLAPIVNALLPVLALHFNVSGSSLQLDDAFIISYNTQHADTTVRKHTDPSDITVNLCLQADNVQGSSILFYGKKPLSNLTTLPCSCSSSCSFDSTLCFDFTSPTKNSDDALFRVIPKQGFAMFHYGSHPHETLPLFSGQRTNCVLTFCCSKSQQQ